MEDTGAELFSFFAELAGVEMLGVLEAGVGVTGAFFLDTTLGLLPLGVLTGVFKAGEEADLGDTAVFLGVAFGFLEDGNDPDRPFGVCLRVSAATFAGVFSTFRAGVGVLATGVLFDDLGVLPRGLCSDDGDVLVGDGD